MTIPCSAIKGQSRRLKEQELNSIEHSFVESGLQRLADYVIGAWCTIYVYCGGLVDAHNTNKEVGCIILLITRLDGP